MEAKMRYKYGALVALLCVINMSVAAQEIRKDIFGDLQFESRDHRYRAELKKDIFDALKYTDNRQNEVVFDKKYLEKKYPRVFRSERDKQQFFREMVRQYSRKNNYKATFSIDIFDHIDIRETTNGQETSLKRSLNGDLTYRFRGHEASLSQWGSTWRYRDDSGNRFDFGEKTWRRLIRKYGSDEKVLWYLINEFFEQ